MVNMSAKFDEDCAHKLISIYVRCDLELWPPKSIRFILSLWLTSAKFNEEAYNGLVSIIFTSLFPYMSIVTLTFDLQNQ